MKITNFSMEYDFNTLRIASQLEIKVDATVITIIMPAAHYYTAQSVIDKIQELVTDYDLYLRIGNNNKFYVDTGYYETYSTLSFIPRTEELAKLIGMIYNTQTDLILSDRYFPNVYKLRPFEYIFVKTNVGIEPKFNDFTSDILEIIPFDYNSTYVVNYKDYGRYGYSQIQRAALNTNYNIFLETETGESINFAKYSMEISIVTY